jgi:predicted pyridoxine 5'-phosphate oxidase superfamily flavin-nucleotide-binding protein
MLTDEIKRFIEAIPVAFVASADEEGQPHLAAGKDIKALDAEHLAFAEWFCLTTLRNVSRNPQVSVTVVDPETGNGYQFSGRVTQTSEAAILDGYAPEVEMPGTPQTLTRFVVRVAEVMAFSAGMHTDLPLGQRT